MQDAVAGVIATAVVMAEDVEETGTAVEIGGARSPTTIAVSKDTSLETISCLEEERTRREAVTAVQKTMDPSPVWTSGFYAGPHAVKNPVYVRYKTGHRSSGAAYVAAGGTTFVPVIPRQMMFPS